MVQIGSWLVATNKYVIIFFTYHAEIHQDEWTTMLRLVVDMVTSLTIVISSWIHC